MRLVTTKEGDQLVDLESFNTISVEPLAEESLETLGIERLTEDQVFFGLWGNHPDADSILIWWGNSNDCLGRLNYIARKTAALDLKVMP